MHILVVRLEDAQGKMMGDLIVHAAAHGYIRAPGIGIVIRTTHVCSAN